MEDETTSPIVLEFPGIPVVWKSHQGYGRKSWNPLFRQKEEVQWRIKKQYRGTPIETAVRVHYEWRVPIPKSFSKKKRESALADKEHPTKRPDCTNMQKFYEDCLKGIVVVDDSQVVDYSGSKVYADIPGVTIFVTPYKEVDMDKKIRKIEKETKKVEKDLKGLEKADKKRDHLVEKGKKAMKGKC